MRSKIRIAFIKFGGMAAGGTEKFLQVLAANLPNDEFDVDYFYCDTAPYVGSDYRHPGTDADRLKFMQASQVRLVEFHVDYKDVTSPIHEWLGTDFGEKFNENNYDIIQTGRAGYPEYPFTKIRKIPIVDSLHLSAGVDNQYNISRVLHISRWSADEWIKKGGDAKRVEIISTFLDIPDKEYKNLRKELGIENKFVYGFHQRKDDWIYSPIPLAAYKRIEDDNTVFLMLNGSDLYKQQAHNLSIKNIIFLPFAQTQEGIYKFLSTLDVFAHGRKDGEVNSAAMAEAMYFGLPIVSHTSSYSNGHIECIGEAGRVLNNIDEYASELKKLKDDKSYYEFRSTEAKKRFAERYELKNQIARIVKIYEDVISNPFPHKIRRLYFHSLNQAWKIIYNRYSLMLYRKLKKIRSKDKE